MSLSYGIQRHAKRYSEGALILIFLKCAQSHGHDGGVVAFITGNVTVTGQ